MVTSAIAGLLMLVMLCAGCRYLYRSSTGKQPLYRVEHCWNENQWRELVSGNERQWKEIVSRNKTD